jgi:hypothetical protein
MIRPFTVSQPSGELAVRMLGVNVRLPGAEAGLGAAGIELSEVGVHGVCTPRGGGVLGGMVGEMGEEQS